MLNRRTTGIAIIIAVIVFAAITIMSGSSGDQVVEKDATSYVKYNPDFPIECEIVKEDDRFVDPILRDREYILDPTGLETFVSVIRSEWAQNVKGLEPESILSLDEIIETNDPPIIYPNDWLCISNSIDNLNYFNGILNQEANS